jgi:DNA-binding CsgD family transcriptional regulator
MIRPSSSAIRSESEPLSTDYNHARRMIGLSQRREAPQFLICDASMQVLFASPELNPTLLSSETLKSIEPHCHQSRMTRAALFHALEETVLRIVPLNAQMFGCVAIFVDSFSHRGSIFEAAKTFGLTRRESQVLQLLLLNNAVSEIAENLSIAGSTVRDHIKSVMRKTATSKRGELIGKVFNVEQDLAHFA